LPRKSPINPFKETPMATRFLAPYSGRSLRGYDPLLDLHREMNRLFDDMFGFGSSSGSGSGGAMAGYASAPRLDMHESEQELTIEAELPGVDPKDLDVRLDGDMLTISGEKRSRRDDKQHNAHLSECSYGRFQRSVQLPFRPEGDDVQAEFEAGVLKLRVPKRPEAMQGSRRIEVKSGQQSLQGAGSSGSESGGQAMTSAMSGGPRSSASGREATTSAGSTDASSGSTTPSKATTPGSPSTNG
jgi:HSP20 family protein